MGSWTIRLAARSIDPERPLRGGITLLKVLDQAYDQPNVVALDCLLGEKQLTGIRKLDKEPERCMQALLRGLESGTPSPKTWFRLPFMAGVRVGD